MKLIAIPILLLTAMPTLAANELEVAIVSSDIQGSTELGSTQVDGSGQVSFTASKNGMQVVIHASKADGTVIGKAETVVGLAETPIYVMTDNGLQKVTIYWGKP